MASDGFAAVVDAGCVHQPKVVGALKPRELPEFKWVNTALSSPQDVVYLSLAGTSLQINHLDQLFR